MSRRVFVTGHRGLVGSALLRSAESGQRILTATRAELDLRNIDRVTDWFQENQPDLVIHAAGTVGGIHANQSRPVDFLYDNSLLHLSVMRAARLANVQKLLYLGSSCIYPREAPQPIEETALLTGPLEPTNQAYAIAKISGVIACQAYREQFGCNFIAAMPTNLYGPHDNFHLTDSHVVPALIRKFHEARVRGESRVEIWGTGRARREFLYVDDLASACWFLLDHYDDADLINIGTGVDVEIAELANLIRDIVYPEARIHFDTSMPDGTPVKRLDVSRIGSLGWQPSTDLEEGLRKTYAWYESSSDPKRD